MTLPPIEEYVASIVASTETEGARLEPDGDWLTCAYLVAYEGDETVVVFDPDLLNDAEGKDVIDRTLYDLIWKGGCVRAAFVNGFWTAPDDGDGGLPADHPDRQEIIAIFVVDVEETVVRLAEVTRGDGPPQLGEWRDGTSYGTTGRFIKKMRTAMLMVRDLAENPGQMLRRVRERAAENGAGQEELARIDSLLELAESNPALIEEMPIHRWWKQHRG